MSFATDGFTHDDVLFLAERLKITLNESFRVVYHDLSKKGELQFTIDGSSAATYALIKYMEPEFSKLSMDRKNVWSNVNLDFPAQSKRSIRYYQLADVIIQSPTIGVKDIVPLNIYSARTAISDVLYNFYKLGYFTRFRPRPHEGYRYILTDTGKQYFLALQFEKQFIIEP